MGLIPAESIDASFVPRRSAVASMMLDGEMVLGAKSPLPFYRLDPIATLVWSCLDGSSSAEQIAQELAAEFEAPCAVVCNEVVTLIRTLGELCFLEGVACDGGEAPPLYPSSLATEPGPSVGRHLVVPPSS